jgi:hypothetical protein
MISTAQQRPAQVAAIRPVSPRKFLGDTGARDYVTVGLPLPAQHR